MASVEIETEKQARRRFWKGLWYIATGAALIMLSLVFSGIALVFVDQPGVHPIAPDVIFFVTLLLGTAWGGIIIWKGVGLTESSVSKKSPDQYGTGYRLAKVIIVILSKTIFRHHRFRWQRIRAGCKEV